MDKTELQHKWMLIGIVTVGVLYSAQLGQTAEPSSKTLGLSNEYWYVEAIDTAGYSDKFYWKPSPRHNVQEEHEMLCGEWGAAIYYDGIPTEQEQAMWLTDKFLYPNWTTNSQFIIESDPVSSDNGNNPVVGLDTGYSRIRNAEVQITIDYEMVDLGAQGPYSPLSFGSLVGGDAFVHSERYVLLQTYTITNITDSPIEDLEFYQMLHGHPADEGNAVVYSVYDSTDHPDPLQDYEPWNDVHREEGSIYAGNFRYDITQWNNSDDPDTSQTHRDWIGFSSTVPPDFIENGYYEGHAAGKPPRPEPPDPLDPPGTHWNIEDRTLNDKPYSFGEVAGAMGWSLGTLDAEGEDNDSVSLTLAIMFGAGPIQTTCEPYEHIAHWSLDEGSGTVAHDSIGDNDGTLIGPPQWVDGFIDGALEFDGAGDYVALSHPVGALTGESVTVSAWVKPGQYMGSGKAYDVLSQTKGALTDLYGYVLYLDVDSSGVCKPGFSLRYIDIAPSSGCYALSGEEIAREEWTWLVGTNDGDSLKLYVDGDLKDSNDSTGRMGVHAEAYIGYLPGDDPFIGMIDDVWVLACPWDGEEGCLPYCHKDYFDWVLMDRPDCWCTPYQCDGDAALDVHPRGYRVYATDLAILSDSWKMKIGDAGLNPCADFDHRAHARGYRVYDADLGILSTNWKLKDEDLDANCMSCPGRGESLPGGGGESITSVAEAVSGEYLLDWLAEIWLDPEVQEAIDAEAWLKLYLSLKE